MIQKAQLSGTYLSDTASRRNVVQRLSQFGIQTTHHLDDGFIFAPDSKAPGLVSALWTPYEANVDYYEAIKTSDIYVVDDEHGLITESMARGILYAMLQHKPIVLQAPPVFCEHVSTLVRRMILDRLNQYVVLDLQHSDEGVIREQLKNLPQAVDYHLSPHRITLIQAIIRNHFRELLRPGPARLAPVRGLATLA